MATVDAVAFDLAAIFAVDGGIGVVDSLWRSGRRNGAIMSPAAIARFLGIDGRWFTCLYDWRFRRSQELELG